MRCLLGNAAVERVRWVLQEYERKSESTEKIDNLMGRDDNTALDRPNTVASTDEHY